MTTRLSIRLAHIAAASLVAAVAVGTHAQNKPNTTVLKGSAVTEDNLLDALTPPASIKTRSLKVTRDAPPPAKPSASLLITFETGKVDLTPKAKQQLDVVARTLKNQQLASLSFTVEGHADPRGDPQANLVLSQGRAESVVAYLTQVGGIDQGRLTAVGKGDKEPIDTDNAAAPENRRVTILTNSN